MSRAELDVIRSPSAETFLRMVTQGFYNRSATALWIYEVIGREWDDLRVISEGLRTETQPQTCAWSMGIWEWIYGIETDENLPLEYRRQALMRRIRGVKPVNPAMLRRGLAALLGTGEEDIEIRDFLRPYTFGVIFRPRPNCLRRPGGPAFAGSQVPAWRLLNQARYHFRASV